MGKFTKLTRRKPSSTNCNKNTLNAEVPPMGSQIVGKKKIGLGTAEGGNGEMGTFRNRERGLRGCRGEIRGRYFGRKVRKHRIEEHQYQESEKGDCVRRTMVLGLKLWKIHLI